MQNKKITEEMYTMLCHHETDDGGVRFVLADCGRSQNTQHKISQWGEGYICPYCSQMIQKACNTTVDDKQICHHCQGDLQQFIVSKEICQHSNQTVKEVKLVCINSKKDEPFIHTLDLGDKMICQACERKLTYKYQDQDTCKICANKTKELLANLKGSLANEELRMIRRLIAMLHERKCIEEVKSELEGHCVSGQPHQQHQASCRIKDEGAFISKYEQLNHKNNKFEFYTKCQKHKDIPISVCSTCVAVLLNVNACPFGCDTKGLSSAKVSKGRVVYSTGFIIFSPLSDQKHIHDHILPMVVVQNITVAKKFDQTEMSSRSICPASGNQIKAEEYPTFASVIRFQPEKYILTGGVIAKSQNSVTTTPNVWLFTITQDKGQLTFEATKLPQMSTSRCSHGSVVLDGEVYVIGGYDGKQWLSSCERFSFKEQKWAAAPSLNYPRCKLTVFPRSRDKHTEIVVLGGLSTSAQVYDYAECLRSSSKEWEKVKLQTDSFGVYPFSSGRASSTQNPSLSTYENILLFGGSNFYEYSSSIDEFVSQQKQRVFKFNETGLQLETKRCFAEIGVLETSDKLKKKMVLFGGCLQHQSIVNVELVSLEVKNQKTIAATYSDVVGSRMLLSQLMQCQGQKYYKKIAEELKSTGRINESQLKDCEKASSRHLLDTLWIAGKPVSNYSMAAEK